MGTRTWDVLAVLISLVIVAAISVTTRGRGESQDAAAYYVTITPDGQSSGTVYTNSGGNTASFTITHVGDEMDPPETYGLWCSGTNGIQCSVQSSIMLYPNSPQNVDVTFSTGSSTGTGYVYLNAQGWTTSFQDQGSRSYTIVQSVSVNPLSVPSSVIQHSEQQIATFTVQNNSGSTKTYTMTCEWGAGPCAASPSSKQIGTGQSFTDTVTFDAGAIPASYNLKLTATSGGDSDFEQQSVTVSEFLSVNAVAENGEVYAIPSALDTVNFIVRFPGQSASSFSMSASCSGSVSNCGVLAVDQTKSVGDTPVTVRATYTAGSNGTSGMITLTATKVGSSWITNAGSLKVTATNSILVSVDDANHGMEFDPDECLTVQAGAGMISCDMYRYVYAFTPVVRMNQTHQLSLIHDLHLRAPWGMVGANIVLPPGVTEPDSIRATLVMNTDTVGTQSYGSSLYAPGQKTRIAFYWEWNSVPDHEQLPRYQVIVQPWVGGSPQTPVSAAGKLLTLTHPFRYGRAWWVGGVERLSVHGDTILWTGPDARGAAYLKSGSIWIRQGRLARDTIVQSGDTLIRKVLGGGQVHFTSSGEHTKTIDRNGHVTRFNQSTVSGWTRLTSIVASTSDTIYKLAYEPTNGRLQTVQVRSANGGWDSYTFYTTWLSNRFLIDSIVAPDGSKTRFKYGGGDVLQEIVGPRGDTTVIGWDYPSVESVTIKTLDVADVVIGYEGSSQIGRSTSGWKAPRAADSLSSRIDGPLSGSADSTRVFTTAWGGVRGVRDALGNTTWIDRQDTLFPGLPTRVRHPNGWQVTTAYTAEGLPDTIIDRSNGAVTTYTWDTKWRQPTTVKSPEGIVSSFTYDTFGNLVTRTVGGFKDSLHYNSSRLVDVAVDPSGAVTTLAYDTYGNLKSVSPPDSVWTHITRNYRGYPTLVTSPTGTASDSVMVATIYDVMGRDSVVVTTNSLDDMKTVVTTTYEFGLLKKIEPLGMDSVEGQYDTTRIGASEWFYDGLGRVKVAKTPASADSLTYDLAGNVTMVVNNGDTVTMTYDVLGQLRSRRTSQKFYSYETWSTYGWNFPQYAPSGLTIAAATDTFTYDVMGRLRTANNGYSRIARTYALNGVLSSEVDSLKNYGSSAFTNHVYQRAYAYDRDGRRVAIFHPSWINSGTDRTEYSYHQTTGRLSSVKDALGTTYSFSYDASGRPLVITAPSVIDSMTYYVDGRLKTRRVRVNGVLQTGPSLYGYDNASRLLLDDFEYNAFGHVTQYLNNGTLEEFERDPFGSPIFHDAGPSEGGQASSIAYETVYPDSTGGRAGKSTGVWTFEAVPKPSGWFGGTKTPSYYPRGYLKGTTTSENAWTFSHGWETATQVGEARSGSRSYYAADGKLMVHQINRDSLVYYPQPDDTLFQDPWGAYEEYWYDALGRRVLRRSRQESPICEYPERCYSSIERYVWDGDQILWEFREANAGDTKDPNPTPSNGQTGHVGYVHAGGIDMPLGMIRNDTSVVLHRDYRGHYLAATNTAGGFLFTTIPWPSTTWTLGHNPVVPTNTATWIGSLPMGQMDRTGMLYRRNRYYDPVTIQFTQPDPIGFAGGFNLYAYAGGDPINNSDPYGLIIVARIAPVDASNSGPIFLWPRQACCKGPGYGGDGGGGGGGRPALKGALVGGAIGAGAGVAVSAGCASVSWGICTAGSPAIIGGFAGFGGSVGGLVGAFADSDVVYSVGEKLRRLIRALGLAGGLILPGDEPTSTVDPTPVDPGPPIVQPIPRPTVAGTDRDSADAPDR